MVVILNIIVFVLTVWYVGMIDCYIWNNLLRHFLISLPELTVGMAVFVLTPIKWLLGLTKMATNTKPNDKNVDICIKSDVMATIMLIIAWIGKEWFLL